MMESSTPDFLQGHSQTPLFISAILLSVLSFQAPPPLHCGPNPLQLGHVLLLALHQVLEGLPNSLVLLHKFLECLFDGT